jgi:hypothetical protein
VVRIIHIIIILFDCPYNGIFSNGNGNKNFLSSLDGQTVLYRITLPYSASTIYVGINIETKVFFSVLSRKLLQTTTLVFA